MAKHEIVNLGKIGDVALNDIPALDECNPGLTPVEYNLVVILPNAPETTGKNVKIILTDETRERMQIASQAARIVAMSPLAFNYEAWPDDSMKPRVGDVIWFPRYAGGEFVGIDGKSYRLLKDKDCAGVIQRAADEMPALRSMDWKAA
jgi:co-chaperonin GroES (HSP10)